jgi:hypothetical protein
MVCLFGLVGLALAGCDDGTPGTAQSAASTDESGCTAEPRFLVCDQSTSSCVDACTAEEIALTCAAPNPGDAIPAPAASRGCHVIPVPTPSTKLFYCCPSES